MLTIRGRVCCGDFDLLAGRNRQTPAVEDGEHAGRVLGCGVTACAFHDGGQVGGHGGGVLVFEAGARGVRG